MNDKPPLYVELTRQGASWCAWQPDIELFGYGTTQQEAVQDFADALMQLAAIFEEERLGPELLRQKEFLDAHWTWSTVQ